MKSQSFGSLPVRDSFGEDEVVDLLSSQEEHASAFAPCAPASTAEGFAEWLDFGGGSSAADVVVKRKVGASGISSTSLKPGADGFAVATWPDGSTSVTELASLLLETSCKPKAKAKGKAKAKPKAKSKAKAKPKAAASSSHVDRKGAKQKGRGHVLNHYLTHMIPVVAAYLGQQGMLSFLMVVPSADGGEDALQALGQEDAWKSTFCFQKNETCSKLF